MRQGFFYESNRCEIDAMLKGLRLRYDPVQDRLLMQFLLGAAEGEDARHALWLTRRLCASWRRDLEAMVKASVEAPPQWSEPVRAVITQAHHAAQAAQVPVRTEKARADDEFAGVEALLVTHIRCGRSKADGRWVLQFERGEQAPTLNLLLNSKTLHALVDAVSRRVQAAGWNLPALAVERQAPDLPAAADGAALH